MRVFLFICCYSFSAFLFSQKNKVDTVKVRSDFNKLISTLEKKYVYYHQKDVDLECIKTYYGNKINTLKSRGHVLLFFEYLLNEFYDSHMHLESNNNYSFRLYSPVYAETKKNKTIITSFWKDQIKGSLPIDIIGAEILAFNDIEFNKAIANFPTHCQNKNNNEVRTWISNKVLAGRYSKPRILTLRTITGKTEILDLDSIQIKEEKGLISVKIKEDIGIIRFNNSLDDSSTKKEFKNTLKEYKDTKGLILDLRNTVGGGNTGVANPIAGYFTDKKRVFQKYKNNNTAFVDYIKPKKPYYSKPLIVLVGRWTGSVGEGLAAGFDGCKIGTVLGTEMAQLAGAVKSYDFDYFDFGYQAPYIEVLQQNKEPREKFIPKNKIICNDSSTDEFITEAIRLIKQQNKLN